ncbi:hypothetical protein GE061_003991 [Apolygus lucorum]|uniref:Large ribosomal subunit protein eL28 n=1 Tax=Apolygus lucorum TaxID=248454 RepID=A0A8S9WZE7_APOLU|nr:hypothetical protein GE061_003991 [Apolygus lucorum]
MNLETNERWPLSFCCLVVDSRGFSSSGNSTFSGKMSAHLSWMIIKNHNSFLVKKRCIKKHFSTEPHNLLNVASFRYNGLVHKKSIDIAPVDKGFKVSWKRAKAAHKPASCYVSRTIKSGPRVALFRLRRLIRCNKYRKDLTKAALRRASAILNSQKRTLKDGKRCEELACELAGFLIERSLVVLEFEGRAALRWKWKRLVRFLWMLQDSEKKKK